MTSVVEQARKRPRLNPDNEGDDSALPSMDWDAIASKVGMPATQCEQRFLTMPVTARAGSVTPDTTAETDETDGPQKEAGKGATTFQEMVQDLVSRAEPAALQAVVQAATSHSTRLDQAQAAALAGLALSEVTQEAQSAQDALAHVVSHVVDLRMQKLEHRLALLDDVEGLLEAERVALELERRDLYTARCRHWFGGA